MTEGKEASQHDGDRRKDAMQIPPVCLATKRVQKTGKPSNRLHAVAVEFGLPATDRPVTVVPPVHVHPAPGKLIAVIGPSGAGKSSALKTIQEQFAAACCLEHVQFPPGKALIDAVAPAAKLGQAMALLTRCGLGDASTWIRPFESLSHGERFRARLARAISLHQDRASAVPILCDEFCASVHRRSALAISHCLRKLVTTMRLNVVVASTGDDLLKDLQPDEIVRLDGKSAARHTTSDPDPNKPICLRRKLRIMPGTKSDYEQFANMHYRTTDELGFVDKIFTLREGRHGNPLGIVVYAHPMLELALRNQATNGWFIRRPDRVNRHLRVLRRLVIHPDVRGCGLGHYLVKRTLPRAGTRFVECLATMGLHNPVFEKAGMKRIGRYDPPRNNREALDQLRGLGVSPYAHDFTRTVTADRRVRAVVRNLVRHWYARTTAGHQDRADMQTPERLARTFVSLINSRPVYYLWKYR